MAEEPRSTLGAAVRQHSGGRETRRVSGAAGTERRPAVDARTATGQHRACHDAGRQGADLDEPTASLTERETELLFARIEDLHRHGVTTISISHRLHEFERIANVVTVMRIGEQYADGEAMVQARHDACPMSRMGTGWDIAKAAVFLDSDDADDITGVCLPVDVGITCKVA